MQPLSIMKKIWKTIVSSYLCIKYPFLKSYFNRKKLIVRYTYLDEMPEGWKKAFGLQLCKELKEALLRESKQKLKNYHVNQVKEKYGSLHWYDSGGNVETDKIIKKYEEISWHTCCKCGRPASVISTGWICPYCDNCIENRNYRDFGLDNYPFYGWTGNVNHRNNWEEIIKEDKNNNI